MVSSNLRRRNFCNYINQDKLGNVRLTYADTDGDGSINPSTEIISEKNYYPFGLKHKGYNNTITSHVNDVATTFGYNGKEESDEFGLETLDFGARNYDPAIGRWMNIDPLAEQTRRHSPYNYAFNNPLRFIDPDGMAPEDIIIWYKNKDGSNASFRLNENNLNDGFQTAFREKNKFLANTLTAINYNLSNGGGDNIRDAVSDDKTFYHIIESVPGSGSQSYDSDGKNTVSWDDTDGLKTENGDILSPATILEHEFDHAVSREFDPDGYDDRTDTQSDSEYTSDEEKRVITGSETKTAKANGEISQDKKQSRYSHKYGNGVKLIPVEGPTSTEEKKKNY